MHGADDRAVQRLGLLELELPAARGLREQLDARGELGHRGRPGRAGAGGAEAQQDDAGDADHRAGAALQAREREGRGHPPLAGARGELPELVDVGVQRGGEVVATKSGLERPPAVHGGAVGVQQPARAPDQERRLLQGVDQRDGAGRQLRRLVHGVRSHDRTHRRTPSGT